MSNTSTIHIKTDFDCKVYDYDQELGTTKAYTYFNIELRKGEHELSFVFIEDESISKTIKYVVEDVDCDYKLVIEIVEVICKKALEELYVSIHFSIAFKLFSLAAEKGYALAQFLLGTCYSCGLGIEKDFAKAVEWYTKAAERGNPSAKRELGYCYENGKGVKKDITKAIEWYTKAAEQGDADAQYHLGTCYEDGEIIEKDITKAIEWYTKAAEQKNDRMLRSCLADRFFDLGRWYESEDNFERNLGKAVECYAKAAELGSEEAPYVLGFLYEKGEGMEKDLGKAIEWYTKAAEKGDRVAQLVLAECYESGKGVEKDLEKAIKWYTKAAEQGNEDAKNALNRLKSINTKHVHYLFFDTETAGLPKNYHALTHWLSNWPRLVQLSWITTDEDCNVLSENDYIIYPDGFTIPEDAVRLHGITTEIAKEKGKPIKEVIDKFMEDFNAAKTIVGHNIDFDKKIIGAELIRLGRNDIMSSKEALCTMKGSVDYCKIPSSHGYKWPKLQELHKKLFGFEFEDAHNSMSDVKATLKCFKEMKERGLFPMKKKGHLTIKTQSFTREEIAAVERNEIVASQHGKSVCFYLKGGGMTFIPLSSNSSKGVGESINLETAKILTISNDHMEVED